MATTGAGYAGRYSALCRCRRWNQTTRWCVLGVASALALVAGCGSESYSPAINAAGAEDHLLQQVDEIREYAWASEFLADQMVPACMRAEGFDYWSMLPGDGGIPAYDAGEPGGVGSEEVALDEVGQRNAAYTKSLDALSRQAYGEALLGGDSGEWLTLEHSNGGVTSYPASGCLAEARLALLGEEDYLLVQDSLVELESLTFEIDDRAYASPEYSNGTRELTTCLREDGFDIPGLGMDIDGLLDPDTEPRAAAAVEACAVELDLAVRFQALQDEAASELIASPRVEAILQRWAERREAIAAVLATAEADVAGG